MVKGSPSPGADPGKPSERTRNLSLTQNFSWTFAGNLLSVASQFGILLVLARLGVTRDVGLYGLALAITAPIFIFVSMSLRDVQVTDVTDDYLFTDYFLLRAGSLIVGLIVTVIVAALSRYSGETALVIVAMGFSKAIDGLSDIMHGLFQKHEQMDKTAISMMGKAIGTFVVFTIVFLVSESLFLAVVSISVVGVVRLITYDAVNSAKLLLGYEAGLATLRRIRLELRTTLHRLGRLRNLALVSLPVGLSSSVISLNTNIPRYFIERYDGPVALGIFTVLAYPLLAGNTVISALSQSALPRLARLNVREERRDFNILLRHLLILGCSLAIVALALSAVFGGTLLRIGFGQEYADHLKVFLALVLAMGLGFISWFLNTALHAMRAFKTILVIHLITLAFVTISSFSFLRDHGIYGAAWIAVASMVLQVALKAAIVRYRSLENTRPAPNVSKAI